jgi:hypothetical protein
VAVWLWLGSVLGVVAPEPPGTAAGPVAMPALPPPVVVEFESWVGVLPAAPGEDVSEAGAVLPAVAPCGFEFELSSAQPFRESRVRATAHSGIVGRFMQFFNSR